MKSKKITNFNYFVEVLNKKWKYAYKMFQQSDEAQTIVSSYDEEGFCIFKQKSEGLYEFTGTAK